jgi:hypothetical protein
MERPEGETGMSIGKTIRHGGRDGKRTRQPCVVMARLLKATSFNTEITEITEKNQRNSFHPMGKMALWDHWSMALP